MSIDGGMGSDLVKYECLRNCKKNMAMPYNGFKRLYLEHIRIQDQLDTYNIKLYQMHLGYVEETLKVIRDGIVLSIQRAHDNLNSP